MDIKGNGGMNDMSNESNYGKYPKPMSMPVMVFWTGLFGGIFWGIMGFFLSFFHLTEIRPNVILEPWLLGNWKNEWQGTVVSILLFGVLSIGVAFIYYALLKKFSHWLVGAAYGVVLFIIVFFFLHPFFPGIKPLTELKWSTIISSICIFIVYGIFIGYSISYEYQNKKAQEKETAT